MVRQLTDAVCDALRQDVDAFFKSRPDLGPADFANYTTLAESTVRKFLHGGIAGGTEVVDQIRGVLDQARAGDILAPGSGNAVVLAEDPNKRTRRVATRGQFYQTQTVKRVAEVMDYCVEHSSIGVITADFGVGKTQAVAEWRRRSARHTESSVFEFDEFTSTNKVEFVRGLGIQFGMTTLLGSAHGGVMFRNLVSLLREHPALLIFDQCEGLRPRVCQVIRQLHDRTHDAGVGVVMLAAPILLQRMMQRKIEDLAALTSRVSIWAPLAGLTKHEMASIVKQEGIAEVDDAAFDLWYRAINGSMRRLMKSVDLLKAKHAGRRVTEKTITGIAGNLWGMQIRGAE